MTLKAYKQHTSLFIKVTCIVLMLLSVLVYFIISNLRKYLQGYSILIEFESVNGIKRGSSLRLRGLPIGHVVDIYARSNHVVIIAKISSIHYLIPKNSLVETNQIGLLNDTVVDIWPLKKIHTSYGDNQINIEINPLSLECLKSNFICHLSCIQGNRGLNYDDLIRSTTRISQRFDDPRLFNLIYIVCHNGLEISDRLLSISTALSDVLCILCNRWK